MRSNAKKENASTVKNTQGELLTRNTGGKEFIFRSVSRMFLTKKRKRTTGNIVLEKQGGGDNIMLSFAQHVSSRKGKKNNHKSIPKVSYF